jgi:hypothetical protein
MNTQKPSSGELSPEAIGGIFIGCLIGLVFIIIICMTIYKYRRTITIKLRKTTHVVPFKSSFGKSTNWKKIFSALKIKRS